ncbi:Protein W05F2.7 [Aphelenchoides avenae]|nr:Protein W05F2.7 [Aphelenchus avenae]
MARAHVAAASAQAKRKHFFGVQRSGRANAASGQMRRDHPEALSDYAQVDVYGLVANRSSAANDARHRCECLQELIQLFDEQYGIGGIAKRPGLFGRLDHKLIRKGHPFNNGPFEKYTMTGETLYCVPNYGDCGASVPLYEWFVASEVDTLLTTRKRFASNEDTNVASMGVLCYIWPLDYLSGDQAPPKRQSDDAELTSSVPHPAVQLLSPEAKEALGKSISVSDLGKPVLA